MNSLIAAYRATPAGKNDARTDEDIISQDGPTWTPEIRSRFPDAVADFERLRPAPSAPAAAPTQAKRFTAADLNPAIFRVPAATSSTPEGAGPVRTLADTGLSAAKGVIGLADAVTGLMDISPQGQILRSATGQLPSELIPLYDPKASTDVLADLQSEASRRQQQNVADAEGFIETAVAVATNPRALLDMAAESAPSMAGGGAVGRTAMRLGQPWLTGLAAKIAARTGLKLSPGVLAAGLGEGVVAAGGQAAGVRNETGDLTPGQAVIAGASGLATAGIGIVGGGLAERLGIADPDKMLAAGVITPSQGSALKQILGGIISEGVFEELPQSAQEQIATNISTGRPWNEGVAEAAAAGMVVGGVMGGGAGTVSVVSGERPTPPPLPARAAAARRAAMGATTTPATSAQPRALTPTARAAVLFQANPAAARERLRLLTAVTSPTAEEVAERDVLKRLSAVATAQPPSTPTTSPQVPPVGAAAAPVVNSQVPQPTDAGSTPAPATTPLVRLPSPAELRLRVQRANRVVEQANRSVPGIKPSDALASVQQEIISGTVTDETVARLEAAAAELEQRSVVEAQSRATARQQEQNARAAAKAERERQAQEKKNAQAVDRLAREIARERREAFREDPAAAVAELTAMRDAALAAGEDTAALDAEIAKFTRRLPKAAAGGETVPRDGGGRRGLDPRGVFRPVRQHRVNVNARVAFLLDPTDGGLEARGADAGVFRQGREIELEETRSRRRSPRPGGFPGGRSRRRPPRPGRSRPATEPPGNFHRPDDSTATRRRTGAPRRW
jgi:hypothetical protein